TGLRWLRTDKGAPFRIDAGLPQCVELKTALDPRIAIIVGDADSRRFMTIAAMQTRFQAAISGLELLLRRGAQSEPKFALGGAAGKDDASELLHLLAERRIGRVAYAGGAIGLAPSYGDQYVLFGP